MEVAGVALGVTSLGLEVYKTLHSFISDIKRAELEHSALSERNDDFGKILDRMMEVVDDQLQNITADDRIFLDNLVKQAEKELASIDYKLRVYNFKRNQPPSRKPQNLLTSSKWALRKDEIESLVKSLDSVKGDMDRFLNIVQWAQNNSTKNQIEGALAAQHAGMMESMRTQEEHYSVTRSIQHDMRTHHFAQASHLIELKDGIEASTITLGAMGKENTSLIISRLEEIALPFRQQQGICATRKRAFRAHWKRSTWRVRVGSFPTRFGTVFVTRRSSKRYAGDVEVESYDEVAAAFFSPFPWLYSFEAVAGFSSRNWGLSAGIQPRRYVRFDDIEVDGERVGSALYASDPNPLMRLLESGAITVHDCDPYYGTLLHEAAMCGEAEICTMLLSRGADPDRAESLPVYQKLGGFCDRTISAGDLLDGLMESPENWDISYAVLVCHWLERSGRNICADTGRAPYNWIIALIEAPQERAWGIDETREYFECFCRLILYLDPDQVKLFEESAGIFFQRTITCAPGRISGLPDLTREISWIVETMRRLDELENLSAIQRIVQERFVIASDFLHRKALDLYADAGDQVVTIKYLRCLLGLAQNPWQCTRETYARYVEAFGVAKIATDPFDGKPIATDLFKSKTDWGDQTERMDIGGFLFDPLGVCPIVLLSGPFLSYLAGRRETFRRWRILAENTTVRTLYGILEHDASGASPPVSSRMYDAYVSPFLPAQLLLYNFKRPSLEERMSDLAEMGQKPGSFMKAMVALSIAQCDLVAVLIFLCHFRGDWEHLSGVFEQLEALENIRIKFFCAPYYEQHWFAAEDPFYYRSRSPRLHRTEAQCLWLIVSVLRLPCGETVVEKALESASAIYGQALSLDLETAAQHTLVRDEDRLPLALRLLESLHQLWPNLCPCSKFDIQRVNRYYSKHRALSRVRKLRGYWDPPRFLYKSPPNAKDVTETRAPSNSECINACKAAKYPDPNDFNLYYVSESNSTALVITDSDYEEEWDAVEIGADDGKDDRCLTAPAAGITWSSLPQHWPTLLFISFAVNVSFVLMAGLYLWRISS